MKRICVFCGSRTGTPPAFAAAAAELGRLLAERRLGLVFGGGSIGLMGIIADAALAGGGEVIGVIPESLKQREIAHSRVPTMHVLPSMHDRKHMMGELSDAFIALPGGLGTLDELFEILTWGQLGMHVKPCGLLNVGGYYDGLLAWLARAQQDDLVQAKHLTQLIVSADPSQVLDQLLRWK